MSLTSEQKEDLRHTLLQAAVIRAPAALTVPQLARAAKKELPFLFENSDAQAACEMLCGLKLLDSATDELGSTKFYRATSAGILKVERE